MPRLNMPVLLSGGGLDSIAYLIIMHNRGIKFATLVVDYGQASFAGELRATQYFCDKYGITILRCISEQIAAYNDTSSCMLWTGNKEHSPFVEGRNISLILKAFEYSKSVILGFCDPGYEPFPDANATFIDTVNTMLRHSFSSSFEASAPFIAIPRKELLYTAYTYDRDLFKASFTCWTPNLDEHSVNGYTRVLECGTCKHCLLKKEQEKEVVQRYEESTC